MRRITGSSTALAAALAIAAQPLLLEAARAQDMQDSRSLEDLIPDSAVEDPEGWAAQGTSAEAQAEEGTALPLDPDAPLDENLVSIPWPEDMDLPEIAPLEPDAEEIVFERFEEEIPPLPEGSEEKISDELILVFPSENSLFPERDEFLDRFKALSTICLLYTSPSPRD